MVIRSGDGMTRSTARPAGINGGTSFNKEIRQLQQTSQVGSLPHRRQTPHKVRENPKFRPQQNQSLSTKAALSPALQEAAWARGVVWEVDPALAREWGLGPGQLR